MRERKRLIIATRGSKLAMWQAEWVRSSIMQLDPSLTVEIKKIKTTGDKILDVPLAKIGGKGLFVKEIEEAILRGDADLAVHSMKDVPTELPEGLHIAAICKREDPRDAFISRKDGDSFEIYGFEELPEGAHVGTSSLRRICQILNKRPDLRISNLRGNVDTRIRKLDEKQFDAIILAVAGVKRLGREDRITQILSTEISLPAIGQGAIGIECRKDDEFTNSIVYKLNHEDTLYCVRAERSFLKRLEGGCQVPIAAHAVIEDRTLRQIIIEGLVGTLKGETIVRDRISGSIDRAEDLGIELAERLLNAGAREILREVYSKE